MRTDRFVSLTGRGRTIKAQEQNVIKHLTIVGNFKKVTELSKGNERGKGKKTYVYINI